MHCTFYQMKKSEMHERRSEALRRRADREPSKSLKDAYTIDAENEESEARRAKEDEAKGEQRGAKRAPHV